MTLIKEFKQIEGYNGYYINSQGIILSCNVGTILRQIRPQIHNSGYYTVKLVKSNGDKKHEFVHRLVAKAFLPNDENLSDVNHKDLDKLNNNLENLEWCSRQNNLKHFYKLSSKTSKSKCKLYKNDEYIGTFDSIRKACIYVNDNFEEVNINSMSNHMRIGIQLYRGKYKIERI